MVDSVDNTIIMFGKYLGLTYQDLLLKDINYCRWLFNLKFTNDANEDLINWLKSGKLLARLEELKVEKMKNAKV